MKKIKEYRDVIAEGICAIIFIIVGFISKFNISIMLPLGGVLVAVMTFIDIDI